MVQNPIIVPQQLPDCLAQFPIKLLHAEQRKNRRQFIYVANVTNGVLKVASKAQKHANSVNLAEIVILPVPASLMCCKKNS